jgi:hypothetical protein
LSRAKHCAVGDKDDAGARQQVRFREQPGDDFRPDAARVAKDQPDRGLHGFIPSAAGPN